MLRPYRSQISEYLLRRGDVGEEYAVAQPIERHPQGGEPLGGGAIDGGDAEVLGEPVLRGEPKALPAQLVVIRQVGPALAGAPGGDVVRKQPGEPEAVVAEMRAQQKGPFPGVVEQLVRSLLEEHSLVTRAARGVTARQGERDEQEVLCAQATADVGQNHAETSL